MRVVFVRYVHISSVINVKYNITDRFSIVLSHSLVAVVFRNVI